ncbi:hypothetical protein DTO207G8_5297 [Paecilomyces variotii]|nr:hypothetical protein DTO169C6_7673 [Paecilomyces variotii]KAJ9251617.1 hypothetical protein DTO207G8_5297 [Paecilomyces variotii]KAJ9383870.1 hypothetical protein DTO063F5_4974 [Paecilomyces variotii]
MFPGMGGYGGFGGGYGGYGGYGGGYGDDYGYGWSPYDESWLFQAPTRTRFFLEEEEECILTFRMIMIMRANSLGIGDAIAVITLGAQDPALSVVMDQITTILVAQNHTIPTSQGDTGVIAILPDPEPILNMDTMTTVKVDGDAIITTAGEVTAITATTRVIGILITHSTDQATDTPNIHPGACSADTF